VHISIKKRHPRLYRHWTFKPVIIYLTLVTFEGRFYRLVAEHKTALFGVVRAVLQHILTD
jgi:hypothetical protein